jgi:hypothetical protein
MVSQTSNESKVKMAITFISAKLWDGNVSY